MPPAAGPDPLLQGSLRNVRDSELQRMDKALRRRMCSIRRREDLDFRARQAALEPYATRRQEALNELRSRGLKPHPQ